MISDGENRVIFLRLRKFGDEVKSDDLEGIRLWLREYWCQWRLGWSSVDLVALALRTSLHVLYHILSESRPPVLPWNQVCSSTNTWVTMYR